MLCITITFKSQIYSLKEKNSNNDIFIYGYSINKEAKSLLICGKEGEKFIE